ncbi:hypothetical protein O9H85_12865 [Paenibacillus filicis]|uniref:Uncharacterized protein n=1 Tax=Paenibacillus gyeongsangnamensis TaxID=3388067 RepID=A0ABT4Q8U8_9BACL|nr:hypothetical protein [Paenibacillus filicis]MCZ8513300.1 hypothetical protein [Paenibacillus filicis]
MPSHHSNSAACIRPLLSVVLLAAALAGCAGGGSDVRPYAADAPLLAAGVDEGPGGLRVSTLHSREAGRLQAYSSGGELRARSFASFSDAAWTWQRQEPPQLLVIGEAWVREHGFPASWARQLYRAGLSRGGWPQVAVVQGTAERFLGTPDGPSKGYCLLQQAGGGKDPFRGGSLAYEEDLVLPYLSLQPTVASPGAVLFKKQQLAGFLTPRQRELLSCLQGTGEPMQLALQESAGPVMTQAVCRTRISGNGDLKHPVLRMRLAVAEHETHRVPGADASVWAGKLRRDSLDLLRLLQEKQTDPLHLSEAIRPLYRGLWTPDRWREAFARADIRLDVHVQFTGGATP